MRKRLIRSMLLVALACVLLTLGFVLPRLHQVFRERALGEMRDIAAGLALWMDSARDKPGALAEAKAQMPGLRFSWIGGDGEVWFDSEVAEPNGLGNHADREEVLEALESGAGSASRLSFSLGESWYYHARRLSDGSILRIAKAEKSIWAEMAALLPSFVWIALLAFVLSILLGEWLTRRLMAPLNRLDLDHPEENEVYEELTPLLHRLGQQNQRIDEQIRAHSEAALTTTTITENMAEGLMLLSPEGRMVSINHSAAGLLGGTPEDFVGRHYVLACRDMDFRAPIEQALRRQRSESRMVLSGRNFQVLADPVCAEEGLEGVVVLLLDITGQEQAEKTRREFSANVSHELKTPLTTIAGYAEMMQAGLANPMDYARLSSTILGEARRLIALIEDIIKLSRLDEQDRPDETLRVDLYALAQGVVERMRPFAQRKGLTLTLSGGEAFVSGMPTLLEEMLQNLVDNAIRYNIEGGTVMVQVGTEGDRALLRISDTGVGIAPEHHVRIFERFYRVDKSHSRETGGTGLGLSIVRHSVQNHGGTVSLESRPGQGTRFTVNLPRER